MFVRPDGPGRRPGRASPAPRLRTAAVIASVLAVLAAVAVPAAAQPRDAGDDLPQVLPTPQEMTRHGADVLLRPVVRLVAGDTVDDATIDVVESALRDAGVDRIVRQEADTPPRGPVTVTIGAPARTPAVAAALERVGADGPEGLPADGYVLATGRGRGGMHVVLAGVDADGVFYAAQTLSQLIDDDGRGRARIPGVVVRDWPAMTLRGVIEGFYGTPWTHEQRLRQMDFYGDVKMNVYAYAPKDDPYHRERWDEPYPAEDLAELAELVDRAERNHVEFIFAVSPGLSICYSSDEDLQLLLDKFQSVYDVGVRHFNVALDDINYTDWHCPEDPETFGEGGAGAGRAQAHLLNRIVEEFVATHPGVQRLQMVPTEYYNVAESPYKKALRTELDDSVIVEWTGTAVVPAAITTEQAAAAVDVFGHDILVWDNYPVNDYAPGQLLMGPFNGREAGLSEVLHGLHANPMNQAEASTIPLATVADFVWNDDAYAPERSLTSAIDLVADGDDVLADALRWFVDVNYTSILNPDNAPLLSPLIAAFWEEYDADSAGDAVAALDAALTEVGAAPDVIRERLDNPVSLDETEVWLTAQEHWARAAAAALDLLVAQAAGDGDTAWAARQEAVAARDAALALRDDTVPHNQTAPKVGTSVLDVLVADVLARNDEWLGVTGDGPTPTTTMPTYQDNVPARMVDDDLSTFYWSSRAVQSGDSVGVDLGSVQELERIAIAMAKETSPRDFIQQAVLEISTDGETWTSLGSFSEEPEIAVTPPDGTEARFVRLRATAGQIQWLVVREFDVDVVGGVTKTVTGAPPAAAGSSLDAAADSNPETVYRASRAPTAGEALTVSYSDARPLEGVIVLSDGDTAATVEVRRDGAWDAIGELDGAYTELAAGGDVEGIRLVWAAGGPAPEVAEVSGWFSRPAAVTVDAEEVIVEAGGGPTTVTVSATAGTLEAVAGTLTVTAPDGWTAEPATTELTLARGQTIEVPVALSAPDGAAPDGEVTATLVVDGESVSTTVPARTVPPVSDTNVATSGTVTASSVEQDLPQFQPEFAIDGDPSTRWSSGRTDDEWLQVDLAEPQRIGRAVLVWETACGEAYELQGSTDGTTWRTLAAVSDGDCGTDELRFDSGEEVTSVRMQGIDRATVFGYSLYEFELYPVE